jgi:gamma-glutamylcysteine synthetase
MYFVAREGQLLSPEGMTFRDYLAKGSQTTGRLWRIGLPISRRCSRVALKTYVEVRSRTEPQDRVIAIPALLKGILYENDS